MINESLQNTIHEHMKKLPEGVQGAIRASGWERKILDIGRKYGLHVDQMEILQTELSLAILGLSKREDFIGEVKREAGIPTEQLNEIVAEINLQIFEPIRDYLRKFQEAEETREETKESLSGLHNEEEEILKVHGFDFDITPRNTKTVASNFSFPKEEKAVQENIQNTEKEDVVRLNQGAANSNSANDLMKLGLDNPEEIEVTPFVKGVEIIEKPKNKISGEDIDLTKLKSANTSNHQQSINISVQGGYGAKDPYREPIE